MRKGISITEQELLIKGVRKPLKKFNIFIFLIILLNLIIVALIFFTNPRNGVEIEGVAIVETSTGTGSGFLVNQDGIFITAEHVVKDESQVGIILRDGSYLEAEVLFTNPENDFALLKASNVDVLPEPLQLGLVDKIIETVEVYVIGFPGGEYSITEGIISQKSEKYIKTSAATNPGNSGGPLVLKEDNSVIGVVVATKLISGQRAEGQHYAVPIDIVENICQSRGYQIRP